MNEMLTFDDVCMRPMYCKFDSRKDVNTEVTIGNSLVTFNFKIPLCSSPMDTVTYAEMAIALSKLGGMPIIHRFHSLDVMKSALIRIKKDAPETYQNVGIAYGASASEIDRVTLAYEMGFRIFCLDIAHGHSKAGGNGVKMVKEKYPDAFVIAGSVCTFAGADYLVACGADMIRVGIGSGSACITNLKTGFGTPQFSTILECARCSKPIIADGGIKKPADVVKALAAGAKMVMLGGMLAGTDETPGEKIPIGFSGYNNMYKIYRGMASREVNEEYFGGLTEWKTAEGISAKIKCKGPVKDVTQDIMGGIRSGLTYAGAETLDDLKKVEFVKRTSSGYIEGTAHFNNEKE